jgi:hypothetical protein
MHWKIVTKPRKMSSNVVIPKFLPSLHITARCARQSAKRAFPKLSKFEPQNVEPFPTTPPPEEGQR